MTFQKIQKTASTKTQTPTKSGFALRPFAPITRQITPTPHQQTEQTQGLVQRKTNLLEIPGLMTEPKRPKSPKKLVQAKLTIEQSGDKYEQEADAIARQLNGSAVQAKSDMVQRTSDTLIQRMKWPFRKKKKVSQPSADQQTTTAPTIDSQPNRFAARSDGSYILLNVQRFPTFDLIMYDATGKEVNNCKVSAQELPEFQSVYLSNISSVIDGDGLAALAVYYIASNTKLANVGATTVLSSAEGFYEHMGMAPSDVELDEWVGDTETVKTKALASLENKWQEF